MECDGGLRSQTSRRLQEVHRRMGQGFSKTAGNLAPVPGATFAFVVLRTHHRLWSEQISGALHDPELPAFRAKRRHWHTKLRSYPKISGPRSSWFPKCSWFFLWRKKDGFDAGPDSELCENTIDPFQITSSFCCGKSAAGTRRNCKAASSENSLYPSCCFCLCPSDGGWFGVSSSVDARARCRRRHVLRGNGVSSDRPGSERRTLLWCRSESRHLPNVGNIPHALGP